MSRPHIRRDFSLLSLPGPSCCFDTPWPSSTLTTAVTVLAAPGVGDLGAVGEDAPAVAGAPIALERLIVAVLVALGPERARVDGGNAADLFLALGRY